MTDPTSGSTSRRSAHHSPVAQPPRSAGTPSNDPEDFIPVKQVLRWQDDGGAPVGG